MTGSAPVGLDGEVIESGPGPIAMMRNLWLLVLVATGFLVFLSQGGHTDAAGDAMGGGLAAILPWLIGMGISVLHAIVRLFKYSDGEGAFFSLLFAVLGSVLLFFEANLLLTWLR
ncbi:MAG: hypothetical protein RL318_1173 [Fibrobacterota bacterium]|jgi:hypothetical protein